MARKKKKKDEKIVVWKNKTTRRRVLPWKLNGPRKVTQSVFLGDWVENRRPKRGDKITIREYLGEGLGNRVVVAEILDSGRTFQTRTLGRSIINATKTSEDNAGKSTRRL